MSTKSLRNFSEEADRLISRLADEIEESEASLKSMTVTHSEVKKLEHTEFADVVIEEFLSRSTLKQGTRSGKTIFGNKNKGGNRNENGGSQMKIIHSSKTGIDSNTIGNQKHLKVERFETFGSHTEETGDNISQMTFLSKVNTQPGRKVRHRISVQSTAEKTLVSNSKISDTKMTALTESILSNDERLKKLESRQWELSLNAKSVIDYTRVQKSTYLLDFHRIIYFS